MAGGHETFRVSSEYVLADVRQTAKIEGISRVNPNGPTIGVNVPVDQADKFRAHLAAAEASAKQAHKAMRTTAEVESANERAAAKKPKEPPSDPSTSKPAGRRAASATSTDA